MQPDTNDSLMTLMEYLKTGSLVVLVEDAQILSGVFTVASLEDYLSKHPDYEKPEANKKDSNLYVIYNPSNRKAMINYIAALTPYEEDDLDDEEWVDGRYMSDEEFKELFEVWRKPNDPPEV